MAFRWTGGGKPSAQMFSRKVRALNSEVRKELEGIGREMSDKAVELSSGTLKLATMRRMGHPYSRRRPQITGMAAGIINVQRGRFRGSWRFRIARAGDKMHLVLYNASPEARFLPPNVKYQGRSRMVVRPIYRRVLNETRAERNRAIKRAIRKGMKT
jgi:hypothetical protein